MASEPPAPNDSPDAFAVLNAYLEELHAGRQPDKAKLLKEHPELLELLTCLDGLHHLSSVSSEGSPLAAADVAETRTVPFPQTMNRTELNPPAESETDFGKYELLGELGRGGMGVVYKARQKDLDRLVAIKMILSSRLASQEHVSRFHAEARSAARLHHPHIVQVYETGQIHGQNYFAMEYVEGRTLADLQRDKKFSPDQAVRQLLPIVRAVGHLHAQGLIHRDLKPSNILVDAGHRSVLTDFGLAKMLDADSRLTGSGAVVGTPSYMAPEQATASREVGPWSDVYSLGAILYELLTGRPPFRAATPLDTLVQVIESEPTLPRELNPAIPRKLELICLKCLDKAWERRYPNAALLAADLDRYLRGEPVAAQPHSWPQRLMRWSRREPALASHLAALALGAAIVQINFQVSHSIPLALHLEVQGLLLIWALVSLGCQFALRWERYAQPARWIWSTCDVTVFTFLIALTDNAATPLVIGYSLFVVMSGLWFQVRLIWFTTIVALLAFAYLAAFEFPAEKLLANPHHFLLFMLSLLVQAFVMAYQVNRVKRLSRYYENRLPK